MSGLAGFVLQPGARIWICGERERMSWWTAATGKRRAGRAF